MLLTDEEKRIEQGERGEAAREALEMQKAVGEYYGAGRFVEITNAHMMGDIEVMGEHGLRYLERLVSLGAACRVPTTTNARCFDFAHADALGQRPERVKRE